MVYMLFDNPADKQNMTFLNGYETAEIRQVYPSQKCNSTKEMLVACKDIIKQSADGDTIICWYDFMAVTALDMKEKLIRILCSAAVGMVATGSF